MRTSVPTLAFTAAWTETIGPCSREKPCVLPSNPPPLETGDVQKHCTDPDHVALVPREPKKSDCCRFSSVAGHDAPVESRNLTGNSCPARQETVKFNKYRIFDFVGSDGQVGQISENAGSRRSTGSTGRRKKSNLDLPDRYYKSICDSILFKKK